MQFRSDSNKINKNFGFIREFFGELKKYFCHWGYNYPPDRFSGVMINGEEYEVVQMFTGKYRYFDSEGCLHDLPYDTKGNPLFTWENINERHLKTIEQCFSTPGGEVHVRAFYSLNDQLEIRKSNFEVLNSTDIEYSIGDQFDEIPSTWQYKDCEIADLTNRDVEYFNRCYQTSGGLIQVEGLESYDHVLGLRVGIYTILQSWNPDIEVGTKYNVIDDDWVVARCEFPDMTERTIVYVNSCYTTPNGKVHIQGYRSVDNELGIREEYYRIAQTTDTNFPVGYMFNDIPSDWEQRVCDFTDLTQRDIEHSTECYQTSGGKVKTYITRSFDGDLNQRVLEVYVLASTDSSIPVGNTYADIPDTWRMIECDFPDLSQRHLREVKQCLSNGEYKIYIEGVALYDNNLQKTAEEYIVLQVDGDDNPYKEGNVIVFIPDGWEVINCGCSGLE